MDYEKIKELNQRILETVNASAQSWQTEKESLRLLKLAREIAMERNIELNKQMKLLEKIY